MSPAPLHAAVVRLREALVSLCARLRREEGQGLTEYGFIAIVIGIAMILIVTVIGHQTANMYNNISGGFAGR